MPRLRVLDLSTDLAGRYAGRVLARNGVDVTRVRLHHRAARPSMRHDGPAMAPGSAFQHYLDDSKQVLDIDFDSGSSVDARARFEHLVQVSDVVLSTFPSDVAEAMGISDDALFSVRADLRVVHVTPYGLTGARSLDPATDATIFAQSGAMLISGSPDAAPIAPKLPVASILGGAFAAMAVLLGASPESSSQSVDLSLFEILVANTERVLSYLTYLESIPHRGVGSGRIEQSSGGGYLAAEDGWFYIFSGYQWFEKVAEMVGRPDLASGDQVASRHERAAEIDEAIRAAVAEYPVSELARRALDLAIPSGPVNTLDMLAGDPQMAARSAVVENDHAIAVDEPFRITVVSPRDAAAAARAVRADTGRSARPDRPLDGLRVLDLSHAYAAPTTSRILADCGADVLKIESVNRLDLLARGMLPYDNDTSGEWWEHSGYFGDRNLGKRSLTLDMASEEGRDLFRRLVPRADVVVANFTPRVLRSWGLGPEQLTEINPSLIVLLMTGFGQEGPKASSPALAGTMESASGFSSMIRRSESDAPGALGFNFGDMVSGVFGALSVLLAAESRRHDGKGSIIDFACAEAPLPFLAQHIVSAESGRFPGCEVDLVHAGRHLLIGSDEDAHAWVLVHVPSPELEDLVTVELGLVEIDPSGVATTSLDRATVCSTLTGLGLIAVPLSNAEDLWFDSGLRERGFFGFVRRRGAVTMPHAPAFPGHFDGKPLGWAPTAVPQLGEANWEIMVDELDVDAAMYADLERRGVIGCQPRGRLPRTFERPLNLDLLEQRGLIRRVAGVRDRLIASFVNDEDAAS